MEDDSRATGTLKGKNISGGCAVGKAFLYTDILSRDLYYYNIGNKEVEGEMKRVRDVFSRVKKDIKKMEKSVKRDIGRDEAAIFAVHAEILKDEDLLREIEKELKNKLVNAENAVRNVFRRWANRFKVSGQEKLESRADDIEDLSRRVLSSFAEDSSGGLENIPPGSIVVSKRLLPSDTVKMKRGNVRGIIVEQGSEASHSAIIARAYGVPALTDVVNATGVIKDGEELIIDSYREIVIRRPGKEETFAYRKKIRSMREEEEKILKKADAAAVTPDGEHVKVYANASSGYDVRTAVERGYDGIGLFRIEQIYMATDILPDEAYLLKKLRSVLRLAADRPVTLRVLDVGGDKQLPYIELEAEPSPALGMRGVRLLLRHENLLRTQLRVFSKLSVDMDVRVLVPMVTFHQEMRRVRDIADECVADIRKGKKLKVTPLKIGAMIETPSAVEDIAKIARESDFLSIGTNDLIQYSVAAGRDNPSVSEYYDRGARIAVKYVKRVVRAAKRNGIECGVCGEMAGDPDWIKVLIDCGVRNLSVSPHLVASVKEIIRKGE